VVESDQLASTLTALNRHYRFVGNTDISTRLPETSVLPVIGQNPISGSVSVLAIWRQGKKTSS
jgi:hypothetical protein